MDEVCDFRRRQAFPTRNSSSSFRLSLISGYWKLGKSFWEGVDRDFFSSFSIKQPSPNSLHNLPAGIHRFQREASQHISVIAPPKFSNS